MRALLPLATLFCLLMSLPLLGTLVRGDGWWVPAVVLMVAATAVSAMYRLTGWNSAPVMPLQILAVLLLITPMFAAHTAPLGIIPTGGSVTHLVQVFEQGMDNINTSAAPVASTAGIELIIALTFAIFMIVADFLAVTSRCPGMVGGLPAALMIVPLVVDDSGLTLWQAVSCTIGFLVLLTVDVWVRSRQWGVQVPSQSLDSRLLGGAARIVTVTLSATAAILMAVTVPQALPFLRTDVFYDMAEGTSVGWTGGNISTDDPVASLQRSLSLPPEQTVLTYTTDADQPEYLRTYALADFDGEKWTMAPVDASDEALITGELPRPAGWRAEPPGGTVTTRVSFDSDTPRTYFLPLPYWGRSIDVSGDWYVDEESHMVFTDETPSTGLSFTARTAVHEPDAYSLSRSGEPHSIPSRFLDLPSGVDPAVQDLTDSLTSGLSSPYQRAIALQEHFSDFTYDLEPPPVPDDADPLTHFLFEDHTGYCEQFAGAMTVMARQADIPARVAVGYTQGKQNGDGRWTVSAGDAHAWPELYFENVGWVRFEPTPSSPHEQGSAVVPDYADGSESLGNLPTPTDEPSESHGPDPTSTESDTPSENEASDSPSEEESEQPEAASPAGGSSSGPNLTWLPYAGAGLVVLLLLALPALVRLGVRGTRISALSGEQALAAHAAWREVRDTCVDVGEHWDLSESPRATATRLALGGAAHEAMWRLALAEETARYAPAPVASDRLHDDLKTVRAALLSGVGVGVRLRAVLLPRSLAPWRDPRPVPIRP